MTRTSGINQRYCFGSRKRPAPAETIPERTYRILPMAFDGAIWFYNLRLQHQIAVLDSMLATGQEISQRVTDDVTASVHIHDIDEKLEKYWPMRPGIGLNWAYQLKVEVDRKVESDPDFNRAVHGKVCFCVNDWINRFQDVMLDDIARARVIEAAHDAPRPSNSKPFLTV